ncbi:MAG: NYN domain-containing protein [Nakamurella sp.]
MEFTDLPAVVQSRVLNLAARSLTGATALQIPRELVAVARFAPARRARRGAVPLARALDSDPAFRALVAHRAAGLDPHGVLTSLTAGTAPDDARDADAADPSALDTDVESAAAPVDAPRLDEADAARVSDIDLLALAYLRAAAAPPGVFERLRTAEETSELRTRLVAAEAELVKLRAAVERDQAGRGTPTEVAGSQDDDGGPTARIERLTTRLREQGSRLREALDAVAHLQQEKDAHAREAARALEIMTRGRTAAEQRAAALATQVSALQAGEEAAEARQEYRERALTRRVELLLETATGAIEGLRSEWTPDPGGRRRPGAPSGPGSAPVDPADVVARRLVRPGAPRLPEIADTARLAEALGLPRAHLIVDGYNVSKNGFGHLTLAEQRERLIRTLAVLAARSGAEVTVVFDGAAVVAPAGHQRGVRVLFSPEGTIADDVIRDLVDAEPTGRPVVVVTSDRAVMTDVGAAGARVARSEVLLAALGR